MPSYNYDVFLSHSAKDKDVVRGIAKRLQNDGLKVWFDEWVLKPGDSIPAKIEEGLELSRVLVLCMSANVFGSDWAQLESGTLRFRDPLNQDRHFIPLRLDSAPIKGSLAQFLHIKWHSSDREREYPKLLEACRAPAVPPKISETLEEIQVTVFSLGDTDSVLSVAWSPDGRRALSGAADNTVRVWEVDSGRCLRVLEGHTGGVLSVAWSADGTCALSGAADHTVRVWEVDSGRCLRVLEGHTNTVRSVAWSPDGRHALSDASDNTVRVWEVESGRCQRVLEGHTGRVLSVAWSPDGKRAYSGAANGVMRIWHLTKTVSGRAIVALPPITVSAHVSVAPAQVLYTNAKVLLVGESGVGKTGLSNYLAHSIKVEDDKPLPSTDGAWATHWPLKHDKDKAGVEREIWLWDFAGQVDYRLVHQLFMDDTAAAVLVFNPQNENPFEGLGHWDRDLQKAARKPFAKLLAAARVDRGGLVVSAASMEKFMKERTFLGPLHVTSAKTGDGCDRLREAIVQAIDWKNIPETTSPALYHRLKQEILSLRDSGLVVHAALICGSL